jgi:hypothetical protein
MARPCQFCQQSIGDNEVCSCSAANGTLGAVVALTEETKAPDTIPNLEQSATEPDLGPPRSGAVENSAVADASVNLAALPQRSADASSSAVDFGAQYPPSGTSLEAWANLVPAAESTPGVPLPEQIVFDSPSDVDLLRFLEEPNPIEPPDFAQLSQSLIRNRKDAATHRKATEQEDEETVEEEPSSDVDLGEVFPDGLCDYSPGRDRIAEAVESGEDLLRQVFADDVDWSEDLMLAELPSSASCSDSEVDLGSSILPEWPSAEEEKANVAPALPLTWKQAAEPRLAPAETVAERPSPELAPKARKTVAPAGPRLRGLRWAVAGGVGSAVLCLVLWSAGVEPPTSWRLATNQPSRELAGAVIRTDREQLLAAQQAELLDKNQQLTAALQATEQQKIVTQQELQKVRDEALQTARALGEQLRSASEAIKTAAQWKDALVRLETTSSQLSELKERLELARGKEAELAKLVEQQTAARAEVERRLAEVSRDLRALVTTPPTPPSVENSSARNSPQAEKHYAAGLRLYFARDFQAAEKELLQACAKDNQDARIYYFLGLTRLGLNQGAAAVVNFEQGKQLEEQGRPDFVTVNAALERVQGQPRQKLNQFRP